MDCKDFNWISVCKVVITILTAIAGVVYWGWSFAKEQGVKEYRSTTTQAEVRQHRRDILQIKHDISDLKAGAADRTRSLRQIKRKLKIDVEPKLVRR